MKAFAKKIGMTQVYDENGRQLAVTVLELLQTAVCQVKETNKNGYSAVVYGLYKPNSSIGKSILNQFPQANEGLAKVTEERKANDDLANQAKINTKIKADDFKEGSKLTVISVSKGKGFSGTVKRHSFRTGPKTHGSHNYRQPGSIGDTGPQRVVKGKKMSGHMGAEKITLKDVEVIRVENEKNRLFVSGPIPGANKSVVTLRQDD